MVAVELYDQPGMRLIIALEVGPRPGQRTGRQSEFEDADGSITG
jgi:hypothetical protein